MGSEMGQQFRREGTYLYLWLIHVDIEQKPIQYCKAIILQLKVNTLKKKKKNAFQVTVSFMMRRKRATNQTSLVCFFKSVERI